jgi:hypothetical protein
MHGGSFPTLPAKVNRALLFSRRPMHPRAAYFG